MTGARIELQGLSKRWNGAGVQAVSLDVPAGAFVALLGPSGCGKSTTLRMIAGLETPDAGRVLIDGRDMTGAEPAARKLSMVFQSYALFPHLDVAENIVFGLKVRGAGRAERDERLARALSLTGLEGLEKRRPGQLSGGQRQRVALARAVVADHPICLMDEPLSNLDAKLRQSVRRDIRALQRRLGMTVIYVTHDQSEAMSMADIAVLMRDGRIEQAGPPETLYQRPATAFAAGFVGAPPMSLVPAEALVPGLGTELLAGVRAEHLGVVAPGEGRARARVADVEFLGSESFASVTLPGSGAEAAPLMARLDGRAALVPGAEVGLIWSDADLHLFDRASGLRRPDPDIPEAGEPRAPAPGAAPVSGPDAPVAAGPSSH